MKVFLHIGPHKTGTTSLQTALRSHAASKRSQYYYPGTGSFPPGHAELAWQFLGLYGRRRDPEVLVREIEAARDAGFTRIVFSSEEFSRALVLDGGFAAFASLCRAYECELVITLSPMPQRILPELQNLIKFGESLDLCSVTELMQVAIRRPGLRPDFLSSAITEIEASSVTVILADKDQPEKLFQGMSTILGESLPIPKVAVDNRSYPYLKMHWLNSLNAQMAGVPDGTTRRIVDAAYAAAVAEHEAIDGLPAPELPGAFRAYVASVWDAQLKFLEVMQDAERLRCLR